MKQLLGLFKFIAHALFGTAGVEIITAILTFAVVGIIRHIAPMSPKLPHVLLTETPGFPLQAAFGLVTGYLLWKITRQRVAFWAWIPPVALLGVMMVRFASAGAGPVDHFVGGGCSLQQRCFDQVMYTLPTVSAAAYSVGAFIASRRSRISPSEVQAN